MIITIVNETGKQIYRGHEANKKVARLTALGNTLVRIEPPGRYSVWDGAAWSESAPPAPRPAPLNAEELFDMLKAKGVVADQDRPRGRA